MKTTSLPVHDWLLFSVVHYINGRVSGVCVGGGGRGGSGSG